MMVKRITCPKCQAVLEVKNPTGVAQKVIACPKCGAHLKVVFHHEIEEAHTFMAGQESAGDGGRTMMAPPVRNAVRYALKVGADIYPLNDGLNTVGRRAPSSQATVQIHTASHALSRNHAQIEIVRYDGNVSRVRISNWQNKNITSVNGQQIKDDDVLLLKPGDQVTMGDVEMTLVISEK